MTDLGTLGSTSFAEGINSKGQIVGRSRIGSPTSFLQHAFLWEHGGPMIDLNTLIPANSPPLLLDAAYINDRGEISGHGLTPSGDNHAFLLIPCGEGDDNKGCEDEAASATATRRSNSTLTVAQRLALRRMMAGFRAGMLRRHPFPIVGAPNN